MFNIVLYQPEIPPNTGNIIRLCANTGCQLHLIKPLGFAMDDKRLRRAGLDYQEWASVRSHADWQQFLEFAIPGRLLMLSTKCQRHYTDVQYQPGDFIVFGPETRGLPATVREGQGADNCLRLPMLADSRSMNLSNAVSVVVYEAWRQQGFAGSR